MLAFPMPQFRNKFWKLRRTFRKSGFTASRSRSWCASTKDHGEDVEVVQFVRVAVEEIVDIPCHCAVVPQITEEIMDVFGWHDRSDDFS